MISVSNAFVWYYAVNVDLYLNLQNQVKGFYTVLQMNLHKVLDNVHEKQE